MSVYKFTGKLGFVSNNKGQALVGLLLAIFIATFFFIGPVLIDHQMDIRDKAKSELYTVMDRIQVEGYLTVEDENNLYDKFESIGCPITSLECPRESQGDSRVLRRPNLSQSTIDIEITCDPEDTGLSIGSLIGASEPENDNFHLKGSVISERVDP